MFDRFRARFAPRIDPFSGGQPWWAERLEEVDGYRAFSDEFAGSSFARGLYRVHDNASGPKGVAAIKEMFPKFYSRVWPFGYDWLGRQFALDFGRIKNGQPSVTLFEPGTGEVLEIPEGLVAFHESEVIDYADAALAEVFFGEWLSSRSPETRLDRGACVGYRIPLFLGGVDRLENLELSDISVYWSVCAQLKSGVSRSAPGAEIGGIDISDDGDE